MNLRAVSLVATLALVSAGQADAHVITTGLGPLYDGASHLALSPKTACLLSPSGCSPG